VIFDSADSACHFCFFPLRISGVPCGDIGSRTLGYFAAQITSQVSEQLFRWAMWCVMVVA
jgi:hypothetical protein